MKKTLKPRAHAPSKPLTLADITVTWQQGDQERSLTGEQLMVALEHAWSCSNFGQGSWDYCLADMDNALNQIRGIESLLGTFACVGTAEVPMSPDAFVALQGALENARAIAETAYLGQWRLKHGLEYRIKVNEPAAAGGAR